MTTTEAAQTVMVVEPDVLVRMVVSEYLRDCGYQVIEGVAAKDVYTVLQSGRAIHVVLADVKLTGETDGFALATQVRHTHPDIDVILTSGVPSVAQHSQQLCEEGPIKKPYHPKDVEARIRLLLERRRASSPP